MRMTRPVSFLFSALRRRSTLQDLPRTIADLAADDIQTTDVMRSELEKYYNNVKDSGKIYTEGRKLEPRRMDVSRHQFVLRLASDEDIKHRYLNAAGKLRFGKLLEDLDVFAVWVAYKHNHGSWVPLVDSSNDTRRSLVTGCVDRIDLHRLNLSGEYDCILDGFVSWTGKSSMETTMRVLQEEPNGNLAQMLQAKFVMVSRDPDNPAKAVPVHPLAHPTIDESVIFNQGAAAAKARRTSESKSLFKLQPNETEIGILHQQFLDSLGDSHSHYNRRQLNDNEVYLEDTRMQSIRICFPVHRNVYGKIFGGFLMREAFELASSTAKFFAGKTTYIFAVDDIVFRRSVEIGDCLFFVAHVTYTQDSCVQVRVEAEVRNLNRSDVTNTFHFSFRTHDGSPVKRVVPREYNTGMMYLNGRRHLLKAIEANDIKPGKPKA